MQIRLTAQQSDAIAAISSELTAQILSECYRRNLHRVADEILADARLRTLTHVAAHGVTDPEKIKSRAKSCAVDAIKSAAIEHKNKKNHLLWILSSQDARHNGDPIAKSEHTIDLDLTEELDWAESQIVSDVSCGLTYAESGRQLGFTPREAAKIYKTAIRKLRAAAAA